MLDHFDGIETGFFVQFELAKEAETVDLVNKSGIVSCANGAAHVLVITERRHPDAVVFFPKHFIVGGPADEVGTVVLWVGAEIFFERGMQILTEPRLVLSAVQIAAGFIDIESRNPVDVGFDHSSENVLQSLWISLAPEVAGVTEAVGFVVVVVAGGKVLNTFGDGGVRNAVPVLDAAGAETDVVPGIGFFYASVVSDGQSDFVSFVRGGFHDVPVHAKEFDTVGAHLFELTNTGAGLVGVGRRRLDRIEHGIDKKARSGGLTGG